jgi:hypothetical protein
MSPTLAYGDDQGWRAYAHRQVVIYANLARECETLWNKLPNSIRKNLLWEYHHFLPDFRQTGQISDVGTISFFATSVLNFPQYEQILPSLAPDYLVPRCFLLQFTGISQIYCTTQNSIHGIGAETMCIGMKYNSII